MSEFSTILAINERETMTFKTKFKIGQKVVHNGLFHTIDGLEITVTAISKEIIYNMVSAFGRILATEAKLITQNVVEGC
jgi:hypothetical protein